MYGHVPDHLSAQTFISAFAAYGATNMCWLLIGSGYGAHNATCA